MKNRKNPLIVQDNWHGKLFFRWLFITLYIFYFMILVLRISRDIFNTGSLSANDKDAMKTGIVLLILFSLFIFGRLLNKKAQNSMRVMKHICSYDEVYEMVENQVFTEIPNMGYDKVYESDLWLKLDGEFVPKNFIVSAYHIPEMRGNHTMCIVLINGRECYYRLAMGLEKVESAFKRFRKMVPNGDFKNTGFWHWEDRTGGKVKKIIKERYKKYISEGHTVQELVNNHVNFMEGIEMKITGQYY